MVSNKSEMTIKEISEIIGVSTTTVYNQIKERDIAVKLIRKVKYAHGKKLEKYLSEHLKEFKEVSNDTSKSIESETINDSKKEFINFDTLKEVSNHLTDELRSQIVKLEEKNSNLEAQIEKLNSGIVETKDEVIAKQDDMNNRLKEYMELLKAQSENLISHQPKPKEESEAVEAEIIEDKPMTPKEFKKTFRSKEWGKKKLKNKYEKYIESL